jgi:hypothetical protein
MRDSQVGKKKALRAEEPLCIVQKCSPTAVRPAENKLRFVKIENLGAKNRGLPIGVEHQKIKTDHGPLKRSDIDGVPQIE